MSLGRSVCRERKKFHGLPRASNILDRGNHIADYIRMAFSPKSPPRPESKSPIPAIRHFNRFYTRQIGILQKGVYESQFTLTEVRLLYELAYHPGTTATELSRELGIDAGYLSRILLSFKKRGWLKRESSSTDRRQAVLSLTQKGSAALRPLEERSKRQVQQMLVRLSPDAQAQLLNAMLCIERILTPEHGRRDSFLLRQHQPGDLGWIVSRHGVLYSNECNYDERFEAMVAGIVADFIEHFDSKRDHCWIAEKDGERIGSVILTHKSAKVAKLRVLIVEPSARGLGIGRRLVQECVRFARQAHYKKVELWTQRELQSARKIYEQEGFQLVKEQRHQNWGRDDLVAETWELNL